MSEHGAINNVTGPVKFLRRKSMTDRNDGQLVSPSPHRIVDSIFVQMGHDKKSKLRETLKSQVSLTGTDRDRDRGRRLTVNSVFNHYCRGYLPPGQTFDYIEKKAQVMDLKHFYDFMKDFGLFPGCFSSRHDVTMLFQKLNLMSKKKESRVELSRSQFETFIQGVLSVKAPAHQRGMTSEDALNTWRRGKLSGDFSHWQHEIISLGPGPQTTTTDHHLTSISEFIPDDPDPDHDKLDAIPDEDIDAEIRQEISVRNEQIRELLELIWGPDSLPSLPFLQQSGISLNSDPMTITKLRLDRDQIQQCIDSVRSQLYQLDQASMESCCSSSQLQIMDDQYVHIIAEVEDAALAKYRLATRVQHLISQMEFILERCELIQGFESDRIRLIQETSDHQQARLSDTECELTRIQDEYEHKLMNLSNEARSATAALVESQSMIKSEQDRNRMLEEQIEFERNQRQCISSQLSSVLERIRLEHEDLLRRQTVMNDGVVRDLRLVLAEKTNHNDHLNDSIKALLQKVAEVEAESRHHIDLYLTEKERNISLEKQMSQNLIDLECSQQTCTSTNRMLNERVQQCSELEQRIRQIEQERDRLAAMIDCRDSDLKAATEMITTMQTKTSELQLNLEQDQELAQRLTNEKSELAMELARTQHALNSMTASWQQISELFERERQNCAQVNHDHQAALKAIGRMESQLSESGRMNEVLREKIIELESDLYQIMSKVQLEMSETIEIYSRIEVETEHLEAGLVNQQNEIDELQIEIQRMGQRLTTYLHAAVEREQHLSKKLEIINVCYSRTSEKNSERYANLQHDIQTERQKANIWQHRAGEFQAILEQIRVLAHTAAGQKRN